MTTKFEMQSDGIPTIDKAPNAVLDYPVDWADPTKGPWLAAGETISAATVTVDSGITVQSTAQTPVDAATKVTVWLAGGTLGTTYLVTVKVVTTSGRTDERSFRIRLVRR